MPFGEKIKIYYDALGRAVRTVNPDLSEQRVLFGVPVSPHAVAGLQPVTGNNRSL